MTDITYTLGVRALETHNEILSCRIRLDWASMFSPTLHKKYTDEMSVLWDEYYFRDQLHQLSVRKDKINEL